MKYKGRITNPRYPGQDFSREKDITVPDQSMNLQEILKRFVRSNEPLPVGHPVNYSEDNPLNVDLGKIPNMDLVDQAAYIDQLKDIQVRHAKQEADKAAKAKILAEQAAKADTERKIRLAAKKLAKQNSASPA